MAWVPKKITSDPLASLIDSQTLEEETYLAKVRPVTRPTAKPTPSPAPTPTPTPTPTPPATRSSLNTTRSSQTFFQSSSLLVTNPSTNIAQSSNPTTTNVSASITGTAITPPITVPSLQTPQVNGNVQPISNGTKDVEDNGNSMLHELQPRIDETITNPVGPVNMDALGNSKSKETREVDSMETIMTKLWKIPDKGTFRNPYFGGRKGESENDSLGKSNKKDDGPKTIKETINAKENNSRAKNVKTKDTQNSIPFIDVDDTDSVNEPSTTDESDDSQLNADDKANGIKKRRSKRKGIKKATTTIVRAEDSNDLPDAKSAINSIKEEKESVKSEVIPGLGSPTPCVKDDETNNNEVDSSSDVKPVIREIKPIQMDVSSSESRDVSPSKEGPSVDAVNSFNGDSEDQTKPKCIRIGCCNSAIAHTDWDNEYCSSDCAVRHCKIAFNTWIESRKSEATF